MFGRICWFDIPGQLQPEIRMAACSLSKSSFKQCSLVRWFNESPKEMRLPNHSDKEYRAILNKGNEAGIPPVEVLKMATSQNARILDMQDRIGTIEK